MSELTTGARAMANTGPWVRLSSTHWGDPGLFGGSRSWLLPYLKRMWR